jgi:hypothetical protein
MHNLPTIVIANFHGLVGLLPFQFFPLLFLPLSPTNLLVLQIDLPLPHFCDVVALTDGLELQLYRSLFFRSEGSHAF